MMGEQTNMDKMEIGNVTLRKRGSSAYEVWRTMLSRCRNPKRKGFANYGGRGITVCKQWERFENFLADIVPRPSMQHTLDRKDNNGNYEPGNCRWATVEEQRNNKRTSRRITYQGLTLTVAQWARRLGVHYGKVHYAVTAKGLTIDQIV